MLERIRKFVTYRDQTYREQIDREFNYRGHSNPSRIVGLSGPTRRWLILGCTLIEVLKEIKVALGSTYLGTILGSAGVWTFFLTYNF